MKHAVILVPFPLSVNGLYLNVKGRGRVKTKSYIKWQQEAALMLMKQNKPEFKSRVDVVVYLGGGRDDSDCDNYNKCCLDLLVNHGILKDDSKLYVRSVKAIWDDETVQNGAMIEIKQI